MIEARYPIVHRLMEPISRQCDAVVGRLRHQHVAGDRVLHHQGQKHVLVIRGVVVLVGRERTIVGRPGNPIRSGPIVQEAPLGGIGEQREGQAVAVGGGQGRGTVVAQAGPAERVAVDDGPNRVALRQDVGDHGGRNGLGEHQPLACGAVVIHDASGSAGQG